MTDRSEGVAWGNWLVSKASGLLDAKLNRRSFIARATLVGSAVAATGCAVVTQPGSPYTRITDCPGGTFCTDGYTEFCCVINFGNNECPPNTIPAGWWRADGSIYCGGGPRYYIDCNEVCCGPSIGNGFCAGCSPCRCAVDCNTRKVHCNYFRYGQCNPQFGEIGPIACRMVLCTPPYPPYTELYCSASAAVDDATANHNADCAAYVPPPPPPPPLAAALATSGAAAVAGSKLVLAARGADGALWYQTYDGTTWAGWTKVGGNVNSQIAGVSQNANASLFFRGADEAVWQVTDNGGTLTPLSNAIGGTITSDPTTVLDADGTTTWVFARGTDNALFVSPQASPGWIRLGGILSSNAAAVVDTAHTMWVFVRGNDSGMSYLQRSGGSWGGFAPLGGPTVTSNPTAVCDPTGRVWMFVRAGDGNLAYWSSVGGWSEDPGTPAHTLTSDPTPIVDSTGTVWVFARSTDNQVWAMALTGASANTWTSLGGPGTGQTVLSDPTPVVFNGSLWVFVVDNGDQGMYSKQWNGSTWSTTWSYLGGVFAPLHA